MPLSDQLREMLEQEENATVSDSFGGTKNGDRAPSFRVAPIRDWIIETSACSTELLAIEVNELRQIFTKAQFRWVVGCLTRYAFLIELTNLKITSTKMKTRSGFQSV